MCLIAKKRITNITKQYAKVENQLKRKQLYYYYHILQEYVDHLPDGEIVLHKLKHIQANLLWLTKKWKQGILIHSSEYFLSR